MESLLRYLVSDDALPVAYGTSRLYSTISEVSDAISYGPNAIVELLDAMLYTVAQTQCLKSQMLYVMAQTK